MAFFIVGVRTFRGGSEPVAPKRAWWRATATGRSSLALGAAFLSLFGFIVLGLFGGMSLAGRAAPYVALGVLLFCAGLFYLHSGFRSGPRRSMQRDE